MDISRFNTYLGNHVLLHIINASCPKQYSSNIINWTSKILVHYKHKYALISDLQDNHACILKSYYQILSFITILMQLKVCTMHYIGCLALIPFSLQFI